MMHATDGTDRIIRAWLHDGSADGEAERNVTDLDGLKHRAGRRLNTTNLITIYGAVALAIVLLWMWLYNPQH